MVSVFVRLLVRCLKSISMKCLSLAQFNPESSYSNVQKGAEELSTVHF